MSSTCNQRYYGEENENDIKLKPFGQVRMMQVCLDYKGTQGELHCIQDGKNLKELAIKSGVKHIVSLYDDFSTQFYASKNDVIQVLVDQLEKCQPGDYFVFQYSGHGTHTEDLDGDEQDGRDQAFCLRTKDGEDEILIDDQIAEIISKYLNPKVPALFIVDACHSGTIIDLQKKNIWKGRKIFAISGCQDNQYSGDTEKGGLCTLSLIQALQKKPVKKRRKTHNASIQFVFNRMVDKMPEQAYNLQKEEQAQEEDFQEQEEQQNEWNQEDFNQGWQQIEDEQEEVHEEMSQGQFLNLSWCGGTDPTHVPFPF